MLRDDRDQGTGKTIWQKHLPSFDRTIVVLQIRAVEQLLVFGNIRLTTTAIVSCLEARSVLFLSQTDVYEGHWS